VSTDLGPTDPQPHEQDLFERTIAVLLRVDLRVDPDDRRSVRQIDADDDRLLDYALAVLTEAFARAAHEIELTEPLLRVRWDAVE
jgi:hypothetical protein